MKVCFDIECNTVNTGNPFTASGKLISYSVMIESEPASFNYYTNLDFLNEIRARMQQATLLIGFNIKFDLHWMARKGIHPRDRVRVWDCQLAEFIISGQLERYPSLDDCLAKYGLGQKDDKIKEYWNLGVDTEDIPVEELEHYNNLDVELTYKLYEKQLEIMDEKQKRLCYVMGLDLLVLAEMEQNGIKFNTTLCESRATETSASLKEVTEKLLEYSPTRDINLDSGQQLSCLLYGGKFEIDYTSQEEATYKSNSKATGAKKGDKYLKTVHNPVVYNCPQLFVPLEKTETKLKKKLNGEEITIYETNEDVLKQLKARSVDQKAIIQLLLLRAEYAKLVDTYYGKLPLLLSKMGWGEFLHGQYNQCVAATGRLSSSNPNMQNFSGDVDELLISRYP